MHLVRSLIPPEKMRARGEASEQCKLIVLIVTTLKHKHIHKLFLFLFRVASGCERAALDGLCCINADANAFNNNKFVNVGSNVAQQRISEVELIKPCLCVCVFTQLVAKRKHLMLMASWMIILKIPCAIVIKSYTRLKCAHILQVICCSQLEFTACLGQHIVSLIGDSPIKNKRYPNLGVAHL